jgi:hypothetical protein
MAQQPGLDPLHNAKSLTWSPLPRLCFTQGYSTVNQSVSAFKLAADQVIDWKDFEVSVRENANHCLGSQTQFIPAQMEREVFYIGNEHGLMARFAHNVGHVMGNVYNICGLPICFADYQVGKTHVGGQSHKIVPDFILMDDQHSIRAVGEGKTFWTKDFRDIEHVVLADWLGRFILTIPA